MTTTSNPLERRTGGRRRGLRKIHASPEWKALRAEFIQDHPWCRMHERLGVKVKTQAPHHPHRESYKAGYMTREVLAQCTPLCNRCHYAVGRGQVLCPVCREHYAPWDADPLMCRPCYDRVHPEIVAARIRDKEKWRVIRNRLNREAREREGMKRARVEIRAILEHLTRSGLHRGGHILQDIEAVIEFIRKTRNPATAPRHRLVQLTDAWLVEKRRKWSH